MRHQQQRTASDLLVSNRSATEPRRALSSERRASTTQGVGPPNAFGASNASLEREADRMAHRALAQPAIDNDGVGRQLASVGERPPPAILGSEVGHPLAHTPRVALENAFGHDLSAVRVYHSHAADQAARSLHASAFAYGNHIVFSEGAYHPGTSAGQRLIAHEVAHVVQQSTGVAPVGIQRQEQPEWMRPSESDIATLDQEGLTEEESALMRELAQLGLDVAGIFDPSPISDTLSAGVAIYQQQYIDAGLSLIGIIPYLGDLAKLGKISKYLKSLEKAVRAAKESKIARKAIGPIVEGLQSAVRRIPIESLPKSAREGFEKLEKALVSASEELSSTRSVPPSTGRPASVPVGRRGQREPKLGNPITVARGTNEPGQINGRKFIGHALDQMQGRGVPPSVVENTIRIGRSAPDPIPGRTRYYDPANKVSVVTELDGTVVTVITGELR